PQLRQDCWPFRPYLCGRPKGICLPQPEGGRMRSKCLTGPCAISLAGALAACQPQLDSALPSGADAYAAIGADAGQPAAAYELRGGDIVTIAVFQEPDLSLEEAMIDNAGDLF